MEFRSMSSKLKIVRTSISHSKKIAALSEQIAHSTVDLHLKEISEFLHGSVMNNMRYKSYTWVSRSTYMHKIQPLRIRPIEPIASEVAYTCGPMSLLQPGIYKS